MEKLKDIWAANSTWGNICWLGRMLLLVLMIPYMVYLVYFGKDSK